MTKRATRIMIAVAVVVMSLAGCASVSNFVHGTSVKLDGSQEVPPVTTTATAKGKFVVTSDHAISGSITVKDMKPKSAHIHMGVAGKNGPILVTLTKTADDTFSVPAGVKFNDAQYAAYKAGEMYVNVHSAKHPGGEIRAQIK